MDMPIDKNEDLLGILHKEEKEARRAYRLPMEHDDEEDHFEPIIKRSKLLIRRADD